MPEMALVAFLSIEAGDAFLEAGMLQEALQSYRLVPSKESLIAKQTEKLESLTKTFSERRKDIGVSGFVWTDFYERLIRSSRSQLEALKESEDYSDPLLVRRGRALLLLKRPFEAWLLFERVANRSQGSLAEAAHLNWILAAKELGRFPQAIAIAEEFLLTYPNSDSINSALNLIADSLIESHRFGEAIVALEKLCRDSVESDLRFASLFRRGQCYMRLANYPSARSDFTEVHESAENPPLGQKSQLWIGISHFLERNYESAADLLQNLSERAVNIELKGEALYRLACS